MVLFLQHIDIEGPSALGWFLKKNNFDFRIFELYNNGLLPKDLSQIEAVIVLGGPMNVYEEDKYPFLKSENAFIQEVIKKGIPYIGICLGSQLLAKAAGAQVIKSPEKEIGFANVTLMPEGKEDDLFAELSDVINVFQWHEDMFQVPKSGKLLAKSSACPNQAFKIGTSAYGLQFHVEITDEDIKNWTKAYFTKTENDEQAAKMLKEYEKYKASLNRTLETIMVNFVNTIEKRKQR